MNQKSQRNKHKILIEKLRKLSFQPDNKSDKQIIYQWKPNGIVKFTDPDVPEHYLECACTHPTCKTLYTIQNIHNGNELDVGTRCIKKFNEINPDWKGNEKIKTIKKEKKEKIIKEQLKKHDIQLSKEYYIKYEESVVKCKIKPRLRTLHSQLEISFNAFGSRQSVGKMTVDVNDFKNRLVTEEEFNVYNTLKNDVLAKMYIEIGNCIQEKQIKDFYCNKNGIWIVLFDDKTTKTTKEIISMRKEEILEKINILIKETKENHWFPYCSYLYDIKHFLEENNLSSITEIVNENSKNMIFNCATSRFKLSLKQCKWIRMTLKKIKNYIINK